MPRLRHAVTGVVVSVSDDTATRLGSEWEPVEEATATARKRAPRRSSASDNEQE